MLLDTHVLLWWFAGDKKLPATARQCIENPSTTVFVSAATFWEVAIKGALGKIKVDLEELNFFLADGQYQRLDVTFEHASKFRQIPSHHRDPFDRMLIAQCEVEQLRLLTSDSFLACYGSCVEIV